MLNAENKKGWTEYCTWLLPAVTEFKNAMAYYGFSPNYGFETQDYIDMIYPGNHPRKMDTVSVFDLPNMRGLAFDDKSQQFVLYQFQGKYYDYWLSGRTLPQNLIAYRIFPYNIIQRAEVNTNRKTNETTQLVSKGVVGNTILGALVAGPVGAAIAANMTPTTVKTQATSIFYSTAFTLYTSDPDYAAIRFIANRFAAQRLDRVRANIEFAHIERSTFSDVPFDVYSRDTKRAYGTVEDIVFTRGNASKFIWNSNLETIEKKFIEFANYINQRLNCKPEQIQHSYMPTRTILQELQTMLTQGLITQAEYDAKKAEILSRM